MAHVSVAQPALPGVVKGAGPVWSHPKAICKPLASYLLRGCSRVAMVFSSYSLGILLVFSSCSAPVISPEPRDQPGSSTKPARGFDSVGLAVIQTESHSPKKGLSMNLNVGQCVSPARS